MLNANADSISLKVLFFGAAGDAVGTKEMLLDAPAPSNVEDVKQILFSNYAALAELSRSLMIAVNEQYATDDTVLNNGDTVAFLPPVSGG